MPTYSQKKAEYKKIGSNWYYVVDLDANTIGTYDIYFTATKDGYSVTSSHKKLTVTKATIPASVITAPAANALTYNGNEQVLVKAGSVGAEYGEIQYRLGTSGSFSTAIPTATDAGTYTVYYKVVGAEGYNDTTAKSIEVTISPVKIKGIGNVASVSKTYEALRFPRPIWRSSTLRVARFPSPRALIRSRTPALPRGRMTLSMRIRRTPARKRPFPSP